jgi:hypothetical protein
MAYIFLRFSLGQRLSREFPAFAGFMCDKFVAFGGEDKGNTS